jgi:hypothetical protein
MTIVNLFGLGLQKLYGIVTKQLYVIYLKPLVLRKLTLAWMRAFASYGTLKIQ